jgi:hypothetical protein
MSKEKPSIFKRVQSVLLSAVAVFAFYIATVGLIPAIFRHVTYGRLQWLNSTPIVLKLLEAYQWPAFALAPVPGMRELFGISADFWCVVTDAPDTT